MHHDFPQIGSLQGDKLKYFSLQDFNISVTEEMLVLVFWQGKGGLASSVDIYMHRDFPQIGSFQGDKLLVVGNLMSLLFRPHHQNHQWAQIQMSEVFVWVSLKEISGKKIRTRNIFYLFCLSSFSFPPARRVCQSQSLTKTVFFARLPNLLVPRDDLLLIIVKSSETKLIPQKHCQHLWCTSHLLARGE